MRKRLLPLLLLLLLLVQPLTVSAAPVDTARNCSLTVHYGQEELAFPGVVTKVYRVAEASPSFQFTLVSPYSSLPVNIYGIKNQQRWKDVATTLKSYIVAQDIRPLLTVSSGEDGNAVFNDLPTGLYLVLVGIAETGTGVYTFEDFMVYLPTPQGSGNFNYDVVSNPKPGEYTPKTEYTVNKLWKDNGYQKERPASVSVGLYKDGELQETVTLNKDNDWSYTWYVHPEDFGEWTVAEQDVPKRYKVSVSANDNVFTITNSIPTSPSSGSVPKTGDTFPLWPYIMAMSLSGVLLLTLGILHKRKKK